ncbi:MAG: hypothetical protein AAGC86_13705 [Pseudomonadota bacterium]
MGLRLFAAGGVTAVLMASAGFAQDCDCGSYPFEPQACFDGCAADLLNSVSLSDLFAKLDLSEDVQSEILALQTSPSPPDSLTGYPEDVQSALTGALSSADPSEIQALMSGN